jgi:hypothetical protein
MFVLRLRAAPGVDGIKALRWLLKRAQRLGLKVIDAIEEREKPAADPVEEGNPSA